MKKTFINIKKFIKTNFNRRIIIFIASALAIYLFISLYFVNHYFFNTIINGVNISLKSHDDANDIIKDYIKNYKLQLIERDGKKEEILGQDIEMYFNKESDISKIDKIQNPCKWITSLLKMSNYYEASLFSYNKDILENKISKLNCLNEDVIEPRNVSFKYSNGLYERVEEVYGNKIYEDKLNEAIKKSISQGKISLDLDENYCYENPKYVYYSHKAIETEELLNKCLEAKISYTFGNKNEILDKDIINEWLYVDKDLEVVVNKRAVNSYLKGLSKKYDTVGIPRQFETSVGKTLEIKGGFYGWEIDCISERKALIENIEHGEVIEKEPLYTQRAICRDEDDIGNTYVEINITRQYLWFYKDGKIVTEGDVVTGNPNKDNATKLGVYMINYKQKGSTLSGEGYESHVIYWMRFNGNIRLHDASWRDSFGGDIYISNGSHGCVNAPLYLAKMIFENIEAGTPVICYEESL